MIAINTALRTMLLVFGLLIMAPSAYTVITSLITRMGEKRTPVAYIDITGTLTDSRDILKVARPLFKDPAIKAVLLRIESPGGAAGTAYAIYEEIVALKKEFKKPVVALVENVCASGGYYIALAADWIICSPAALIGSVGVVLPPQFKVKKLLQKYDVDVETTSAGSYKTVGSPFSETTPEQAELLQNVVNDVYTQFITSVSMARPQLMLEKASEWANGKIFPGARALELHMVDANGSQSTAEAEIKKRAGFEGEIEWRKPPEPSFLEKLIGKGGLRTMAQQAVHDWLLCSELTVADQLRVVL